MKGAAWRHDAAAPVCSLPPADRRRARADQRHLHPGAPYFHNGFAADLVAVVAFYDTRSGIELTRQEKSDPGRFLRTL
jgi:hypothetical protein